MAEVVYYEVESSNVESVGFSHEDGTLYVRFLPKGNSPGSLYRYTGVEPSVFQEFLNAPSMGQFVWRNLRDRYPYERLE